MALQAGGDSAGREGAGPGRCLTAETRSISSRWKRLCRPGRQARDRAPGAGQGGQGWARGLSVEQGARGGPGGQARDRGPHLLQPRGLCPCLLPAAQFLGSTPRPVPPSICKSQCLGDSQPPPHPVIPQVHAADSASYWHPNSTWPRGAPQLPLSSLRGPRRPPCFSPERPPPCSGLFTPRCPASPLGLFASHQRCRGQRGHSQHRTPPAQPRLWGTPPPSARGPLRQERGKRKGQEEEGFGAGAGAAGALRPSAPTAWETGRRTPGACGLRVHAVQTAAHAQRTHTLSAPYVQC